MVNRDIVKQVEKIADFDHANDFKDTCGWLMAEIVDANQREKRLQLMIVLSRLNQSQTDYQLQRVLNR